MTLERQTVLYGFSGAGALLAAALIYQVAAPLPDFDPPQMQLKTRTQQIAAVVPVSTPPPEAFAEIGARPMFSPARKGVASATTGEATTQPPEVTLVGIIVDATDRMAMLRTPARRSRARSVSARRSPAGSSARSRPTASCSAPARPATRSGSTRTRPRPSRPPRRPPPLRSSIDMCNVQIDRVQSPEEVGPARENSFRNSALDAFAAPLLPCRRARPPAPPTRRPSHPPPRAPLRRRQDRRPFRRTPDATPLATRNQAPSSRSIPAPVRSPEPSVCIARRPPHR